MLSRGEWSAPLDRRVSLPLDGLTLRDALTRVSAAANVRLTYIAELLPLERRVCLSLSSTRTGDALVALLAGTSVAPIAAGRDQVVLAPTTADAQARARAAIRVGTLERVIVTGRRGDDPVRGAALSVDVIEGRDLEARGATTLASALNGAVPGLWIWNAAPGAATVRMGSMRGASSFGATAPKVYIDGVEVANPLVLTQLRPETVDRVEVIRGPQGSALYGADAIGGVLQITTRHDASSTGVTTQLRTSAGMTASGSGGSVASQDHSLSIRAGSATRSGGLSFATSRLGDYVPSGSTSQWNAAGDLRLVGSRRSLVASARFFSQEASNPTALLANATLATPTGRPNGSRLTTSAPTRWGPFDSTRGEFSLNSIAWGTSNTPPSSGAAVSIAPQSTQQYTIGAVLTESGTHWTTRLTVGADGYRLNNPIAELGLAGSSADSAILAASGAADRLTMRFGSNRIATVSENIRATVLVGAEHTTLRDATGPAPASIASSTVAPTSLLRHSTGGLAKVDFDIGGTLFLSAGGRIEQNLGYTALGQLSVLPTVGAAFVREVGPASVKLRSAWGRAIRPPRAPSLTMGPAVNRTTMAAGLEPEIQSGLESGVDLSIGQALSLSVVRFDQRASGLIQASTVTADLSPWRQAGARRMVTALQNVGVIANRGWELSGTGRTGALALSGTLSLVSSRVARVAAGYLGDLRVGDRMLDVPAITAGVNATWTAAHWSASIGGTRAGDWIGYDRAAIARDLARGTRTPEQLTGAVLRRYWRAYDGVDRLRAALTRDLTQRLTLTFSGENLLNVQQGEPDNLTILPGRTIAAGLRAKF
jgi:iron complex outermembrane receptor protein